MHDHNTCIHFYQIPDNLPNGYPTRNLKPRPFVLEGNLLFVTAYFMEPCKNISMIYFVNTCRDISSE